MKYRIAIKLTRPKGQTVEDHLEIEAANDDEADAIARGREDELLRHGGPALVNRTMWKESGEW